MLRKDLRLSSCCRHLVYVLLQEGGKLHLLPIVAYLDIVLLTGETAHFQSEVVALWNEILELGDLLGAPIHASIKALKHRTVNGLYGIGQKLRGDLSNALGGRDLIVSIIYKRHHNAPINFSLDLCSVPLSVGAVVGDTDPSRSQAGRIQLRLWPAVGHDVSKFVHHVLKIGSELEGLAVETGR